MRGGTGHGESVSDIPNASRFASCSLSSTKNKAPRETLGLFQTGCLDYPGARLQLFTALRAPLRRSGDRRSHDGWAARDIDRDDTRAGVGSTCGRNHVGVLGASDTRDGRSWRCRRAGQHTGTASSRGHRQPVGRLHRPCDALGVITTRCREGIQIRQATCRIRKRARCRQIRRATTQ